MEKAFADDQSVRPDFLKEETKEIVPAFIAEKKTQEVSRGALRGTAMHRFMECFDFCNYRGYIDPDVFLRGVHDPDFLHGEVYAGRGLSFREQGGLRTEIT